MGLGKTRQAIIALRTAEPGGPYLVVYPASVKRNWAREIATALPQAMVRIIGGKSDDAPLDAEWVVVNYDILAAHAERLAAHRWAGIVFDEAHYIKNHQSQRSKHSRKLVDATPDPVVYAAHRHAAHEPAARPVPAAAAVRPRTRQELPQLREALLRGVPERLRLGDRRRVEPG